MKTLRINGTPILNFLDLQSQFSPSELYRQLEAFERFAAVHCVPLPLQLTSLESGKRYHAKHLNKEFWHGLLRRVDWPEEGSCAWDCLCTLTGQLLRSLEAEQEEALAAAQNTLREEQADAGLEEKLSFIEHTAGTGQDPRKTVLMLAICELAEIDPRKTAPGDWLVPEGSVRSAFRAFAGDAGTEPVSFPYEQTAYLITGSLVKYWCYDSETLEPCAKIRTVRLEAKASENQYAVARVELYSEKTGRCVRNVMLKSGEFRYCSVSGGRIIRFLPAVSISDDLCLFRPDYKKPEVQVLPKNGESWTLDTEHVTCFSTGPKNTGFLLIQDGQVNTMFYKTAEDYMTRLQLEMLMLPAIEARVCQEGYEILLEDGTTISNLPGGCRSGIPTLYPALPEVRGLSDVQELALSETRRSAAVLCGAGVQARICFDGVDSVFQISENGGIPVLTWQN